MSATPRLSGRLALLVLPLTLLLPPALHAQSGKPAPLSAPLPSQQIEPGDPPSRVGRVARVQGEVSFRLPGEEAWQPAGLNLPVLAGNAVYTGADGRALLEFGQSRLAIDPGSDLQIATLDDAAFAATLPQGAVYLALAGLQPGDTGAVVTPQGVVTLTGNGRYLIEVTEGRPLHVAVLEGAAVVRTPAGETRLAAGQAALFAEGAAPQPERAGAGTPLVAWAEAGAPKGRAPLPRAVAGMTGVTDLAAYGNWDRSPEYGDIWYPRAVATDWAPYRDGAWRWVEPWGWTWVDAQPWGYAPSHYGRWVQIGPRWAWAPVAAWQAGPPPRPIWSPALVRFYGGGEGRPTGWVPLAPREPFYPWYRASPRYVERVNFRQVTNIAVVRQAWTVRGRDPAEAWRGQPFDQMRNRRWATLVPGEAFRDSRPVWDAQRRLPEAERQQFFRQPEARGPEGPPRPGPATAGLGPREAQRIGIPPDALRGPQPRPGPPPAAHTDLRPPQGWPDRGRRPGADAPRPPDADLRRAPDDQPRQGADPRRAPDDQPRQGAEPRRAPDQQPRQGGDPRRSLDDQPRQGQEGRPKGQGGEVRRGAELPPARADSDPRRGAERPQRADPTPDARPAPEPRRSDEQPPKRPDAAPGRGADGETRRPDGDARRQAEMQQQRQAADQQRRNADQQQRQAAEQQQRQSADQQRRNAEQQQRQAAEQQQRQAADQQRRNADQQQRQAAEQQQRQAADQQRRNADQQQRQAAEQQQRQAADQQRRNADQHQRQAAEQQQRQAADQQRRNAEQQQQRRQNEDRR